MEKYRHASLFSGIGGFDLAAEWMGWENVFHCEIESFPRQILNYYWPNSISYEDIKRTDFTIHRGQIDILTGGFPCQPYSVAGKRKGKEDERHLWPEMLRAISEIQPTWVIGENVSGLINWNDGMVFEEVQTDLEAKGYEVLPFILPAASVNAPHKRDRVWFVAYSSNNRSKLESWRSEDRRKGGVLSRKIRQRSKFKRGCEITPNTNGKRWDHRGNYRKERHFFYDKKRNTQKSKPTRNEWKCRFGKVRSVWNVADTKSNSCRGEYFEKSKQRQLRRQNIGNDATHPQCGRRLQILQNAKKRQPNGYEFDPNFKQNDWAKFPTQPPICNGNDGISSRLDGITFPKWRAESIKGGGNAIVPQVALNIFKSIELFNNQQPGHRD